MPSALLAQAYALALLAAPLRQPLLQPCAAPSACASAPASLPTVLLCAAADALACVGARALLALGAALLAGAALAGCSARAAAGRAERARWARELAALREAVQWGALKAEALARAQAALQAALQGEGERRAALEAALAAEGAQRAALAAAQQAQAAQRAAAAAAAAEAEEQQRAAEAAKAPSVWVVRAAAPHPHQQPHPSPPPPPLPLHSPSSWQQPWQAAAAAPPQPPCPRCLLQQRQGAGARLRDTLDFVAWAAPRQVVGGETWEGAALREALQRAGAAEAAAARSAARSAELEGELQRLRTAQAAALAAQEAALRAAADAELARARERQQAQVQEALAREAEARARAEALERAAAAAAAAARQQPAALRPPHPPSPPAYVEPAVHASVDNPLLPKGFRSIAAFVKHLRSEAVGMRASQLAVFVDCTKSNVANSNVSYARRDGTFRSLHDVSDPYDPNPYHRVIRVLGRQLEEFDDDKQIPLYGFGDKFTKDKAVFPYSRYADIDRAYRAGKAGEAELAALLASDAQPSDGIDGVLALYTATQGSVHLQGPTSFAPAIEKTIAIVEATGEFTICLIIADGCIDSANALKASQAAVVRASKYPISIIAVGVGDGEPGRSESERWEQMNHFDELIQDRAFDNFHFVEHNLVRVVSRETKIPEDECFALMALSELEDQFLLLKKMGLIKEKTEGAA